METPKLIRRSAKGRKKYLLPFGDVHLGAPTCNLEKAKKYIQWAVENDALNTVRPNTDLRPLGGNIAF